MTDLQTAAQQALEAMENHAKQYPHMQKGYTVDAITALRAALTQQAEPVEPVAKCIDDICSKHFGRVEAFDYLPRDTLLYTAPPQRKPLTEEEIRDLWSWAMTAEAERTATTQQHAFARAVERAHGIGEGA